MYNPYSVDLGRVRQQELIAEADRRRLVRAARKPRGPRRALAGRRTDADTVVDGRPFPPRPALPLQA